MIKPVFAIFCLFTLSIFTSKIFAAGPSVAVIPLGGNAWAKGKATITDAGLTNWKDAASVTQIFFLTAAAQQFDLALRLRLPAGKSTISITVGKKVFVKQISNTGFDTISIGRITVSQPGHVRVTLRGISKTGSVYAEVTDLIVKNINPDNQLTYVAIGSSFHFGRRGPSVHLRYAVPDSLKKDIKWFYSEIMVPTKMDVVGSYYMADGFNGGYFGMQVNSATERRNLFSVWSPFNTDDPKSIPDSLRVKLGRKGEKVHGGEFGDEGSGGQSYLRYPWQAGKTYGFLLGAEPNPATGSTTYTAFFKDVTANKWMLIAAFIRPKTLSNLGGLYSFLENFEPDNGDRVRMAHYQNQWIGNSKDQWYELTGATYTGDETARKNYRKDYAGGSTGSSFFLKNGGFFDALIPLNTPLKRAKSSKPLLGTPGPVFERKF